MRIEIQVLKKTENKERFIKNYLPEYMYRVYEAAVDLKKFKPIDDEFNIDSNKIITTALKNLLITNNGQKVYIISVNKNLKVDGNSLETSLNLISYGNRDVKGYPIVLNLFKAISEHINAIYKEWLNVDKVLRPSSDGEDTGLGEGSKLGSAVSK